MNILFIDNQGINRKYLGYLQKKYPRQLEGQKQYILFIARDVTKKHNVFFPFQKGEPDIIHTFGGFSQPIFFKKKTPAVYSITQSPTSPKRIIKEFPLYFCEGPPIKMFILGLLPQPWFCRYLKKFDCVLTVTEYEREFLIKNGVPGDTVIKLGVGIDHEFFKPKTVGGNDDFFVISYFANISAFKGVDIIYKLAKSLRNDKNVKFRVALDVRVAMGGYPQEYSGIAKKLTKLKNVEVFGKLNNLNEFLNSSNLVFLPFTTMVGNFPIPFVLLEAMSTENLVLTSDLPTLKELVKDGKTGFVSETKRFRNKIEWIRNNKEDLNHIKKNARKFIVKNHDWKKITERLISIYDKVIK